MEEQLNPAQQLWQVEFALRREWYERWMTPVNHALYMRDFNAAREHCAAAIADLATGKLPVGVREALGYVLLIYQKRIGWQEQTHTWDRNACMATLELFSKPANDPFAEIERVAQRFQLLLHGAMDGYLELQRSDIDEVLRMIPDHDLRVQYWHWIAGWAFKHHDLELLEQAFSEHLIYPSTSMGSAKWQRINLMYQLATQKATRRDVLETVMTLVLKPQYDEFHDSLWPVCEAQGLVDDELCQLLAERKEMIWSNRKELQPEPRTKSLRSP